MSCSRLLWVIPLCSWLFAGDLIAQEAEVPVEPLTLSTLLDKIRENNPELRASQLEADALSLRSSQVASLPDPRVAITYQPYPLFTARGTQRTQWRVEQAIPFPGKLGLKEDIAGFGAEIAKHETHTFEQDLLFDAKRAFIELYRIQQQQQLIQAFHTRLQDFEENAATKYVVGSGLQQAILKAQLERNALLQQQLSLELLHRSAAETLGQLLNTPVSDMSSELDSVELAMPAGELASEDVLFDAARRLRPEARALEAAQQKTDTQIALAKKEFLPDFGFNVTYFDVGPANIPATASGRDAFAIGVSLNVPLWRGKLNAQLAEARTRKNQVAARIEGLDTAFRAQIADLISQISQEKRQLALFQEALIPQAETTREATLSAYTTGRTNFLDLLDAERMLFSLQAGYEDAIARYMKAIAALERALGVSSLSDIDRL